MTTTTIAAAAALILIALPANAKPSDLAREFCGDRYCGFYATVPPDRMNLSIYHSPGTAAHRAKRTARHHHARRTGLRDYGSRYGRTLGGYGRAIAASAKLADLVPGLAAKVRQIVLHCGSRLISGYRPGARVAGTGRRSLHSAYPSKAADLAGNPGCIYGLLAGWRGGYSIDYGRVRHIHVSLDLAGRREMGARFAHYGRRVRLAARYR